MCDIFSYFSEKTGFDISCKLPKTICMKYQTLFSGNNKKNISKCRLLKILPRVLSFKHARSIVTVPFSPFHSICDLQAIECSHEVSDPWHLSHRSQVFRCHFSFNARKGTYLHKNFRHIDLLVTRRLFRICTVCHCLQTFRSLWTSSKQLI